MTTAVSADGKMSSYFVNSLMQYYCNQSTPMYAAAAAAAAARTGHRVDGSVDCCTVIADNNDAASIFSSSSSRRHHQIGPSNHRGSRLPARPWPQSACLYSVDTQNMSDCRHATPFNSDTVAQSSSSACCTSTNVSHLLPYETKSAHHQQMDSASSVYGDYHQQVYDDRSLVETNSHCGTYKLERPSPTSTPTTELHQQDRLEGWISSSHCVVNNKAEVADSVQTEGQTSEKNVDSTPLNDHHTTITDDDSDDVATGSASTKTSTSMTTVSEQHQQQQQMSDKNSCDVRQTQHGVVYPIYPWMTRVHSTHGKSDNQDANYRSR